MNTAATTPIQNEIENVEVVRDADGSIVEIVVTAFSAELLSDVRVTFTATGFIAEVWFGEDFEFAGGNNIASDLPEGVDVAAIETVFDAARGSWTAEEEAFAERLF